MAETTTHDETIDATVRFNDGPEVPFDDFRALVERMNVMRVNARRFALAWVNAFLATGDDPERPVLNKTLCVEFYRDGVLLVACDGTVLFRSWVPTVEPRGNADFPEVEESPDRSIVVTDAEGFGLAFMRSLMRVTGADEHALEELSLHVAEQDENATIPLGAEFMKERLELRALGQRIDLRLYEREYPGWRSAHGSMFDGERVPGIRIAPRMFQLVGKIKGASFVDLKFHGDDKRVEFVAAGVETDVRGLIMPLRRSPTEE